MKIGLKNKIFALNDEKISNKNGQKKTYIKTDDVEPIVLIIFEYKNKNLW